MRIGIDLGGTKIEGALINRSGVIEETIRVATPKGDYAATLKVITNLVAQLDELAGQRLPIGLAAPGALSRLTGKMKNCNSTCLIGQALKEDLTNLLKRDLRLANDADCFTLSEATDGAGSGDDMVFGVILGTGVGGGICYKGELVQGVNGIAGEWGHNPMPPIVKDRDRWQHESRSCYCGRENCIETWLSGPAFEHSYYRLTREQLPVEVIIRKSRAGEAEAAAALDLYQECLAAALATVINLLDPGIIVLGGGLSNIESLYDEVPLRWSKYLFTDQSLTRLKKPAYGDSSGIRGAAWLWP